MLKRNLIWCGTSLEDVRRFPKITRQRIGVELEAIRKNQAPADSKPMPIIGNGVRELRIKTENQYRIIYLVKLIDTVHILHCFVKKTRRTQKVDIDIARSRYKVVLREYRTG